MRLLLAVTQLLLLTLPSLALTTKPLSWRVDTALSDAANRRRALLTEAAATLATGLLLTFPTTPAIAAAEDDDNEFIQLLKSRSQGKDYSTSTNGSIGVKSLSSSKFSQQYQRPSFVGVKRKDGSIQMVDSVEAKQLQADGKIVADYETYIDEKGKEHFDYIKGKVYRYVD